MADSNLLAGSVYAFTEHLLHNSRMQVRIVQYTHFLNEQTNEPSTIWWQVNNSESPQRYATIIYTGKRSAVRE